MITLLVFETFLKLVKKCDSVLRRTVQLRFSILIIFGPVESNFSRLDGIMESNYLLRLAE